jgi:hypothetical protein
MNDILDLHDLHVRDETIGGSPRHSTRFRSLNIKVTCLDTSLAQVIYFNS